MVNPMELYKFNHIIDDASEVEDVEEISSRHQADQKIRQMHSRDAQSRTWLVRLSLSQKKRLAYY
jgi:hypothetical protein